MTEDETRPLFSRQVGPKYNTYDLSFESLISALYSIPSVQKAFYEEYQKNIFDRSTSSTERDKVKYFVDKFLMMRSNSVMPTVGTENKPDESESAEVTFEEIMNELPKNIRNLFTFSMRVELINFFNQRTVNQMVWERRHKGINVGSNFTSVSQNIQGQFSDDLTNKEVTQRMASKFNCRIEGYFIDEISKNLAAEKIAKKFQLKYTMASHPEVFTLFLKRIAKISEDKCNHYLNRSPFKIEKEILLNSKSYILISQILIDCEFGLYTVALDIGNNKYYRYDSNGLVSEYVGTDELDTNSIAMFYIPKESILTLNIDELRNLRDIQAFLNPKPVQSSGTKRTFDEIGETISKPPATQQQECQFYKPDYRLYPSYLQMFETIENELKKAAEFWPAELLDFYAKFIYKVYPLGSQQYSFKTGPNRQPYYAVEIFLTALASNSKVVFKLFEFAEADDDYNSIENNLAIVIVKMLLGCKNIPLERLVAAYKAKIGPLFNIDVNLKLKDSGLRKAFKTLMLYLKSSLIEIPYINVVKYVGLESDDPIEILSARMASPIKLYEFIKPREAIIKGIWYDSIESSCNRNRRIFKPKSEISVIEVERWDKTGNRKVFQPTILKLNSDDYEQIGVVTLGADSVNFEAYFIDNFCGNLAYKSLVPGMKSESHPFTEKNKEYFKEASESKSILLFFTKKSSENPGISYSRRIPRKLFRKTLSNYASEFNIEIKI